MKSSIVCKLHVAVVCGVLLLIGSPLYANAFSGRIVYVEGTVSLFRSGSEVADTGIGSPVHPEDMLITGSNGFIELEIQYPDSSSARITIDPESSFRFSSDSGSSDVTVTAQYGSMDFKVNRRGRETAFNVRARGAAMGVRGTEFDILVAPDDSVLITCVSGSVEVASDQGPRSVARPGMVVEWLSDDGVQPQEVAVDALDNFRDDWLSLRESIFRRGAPVFIQGYSRRYKEAKPKFEEAYRNLAGHRSLLEQATNQQNQQGMGATVQARTRVSPAAVQMRSILPVFDEVFGQLVVLRRYHAEGIGHTDISDSQNSHEFFREFQSELRSVRQQLSEAYYLMDLFSRLEVMPGSGIPDSQRPF